MNRRPERIGAEGIRGVGRRGVRWFLLAGVGLLGPAVLAAPASATGPSYPGETLSLAQNGPAVAGQVTDIVATGQQTDVNDDAGGFDLEVFEKDPNIDPTCSPDYWDETNNALTDPSELHFIWGDWQGLDTTFNVPFKVVFPQPGPVLLCAYSTWITDTAASAVLTVNVTSSTPPANSSPTTTTPTTTTPNPGLTPPVNPPAMSKPVSDAPPRLSRLHNKLRCSPGSWSNSPTSFSYRWLAGRRQVRGAQRSVLSVSRSLRGHQVRCSVIATNGAGTTTALSRPVWVR